MKIQCPWDHEEIRNGTVCPRCGRDLTLLVRVCNLPQSLYNQALTEWHMDRGSESINLLKAAIAMAPRFIAARLLLGKILMRLGHHSEALHCLRQILDVDRNNDTAQSLIALIQPESHSAFRRYVPWIAGFLLLLGPALSVFYTEQAVKNRVLPSVTRVENVVATQGDDVRGQLELVRSEIAQSAQSLVALSQHQERAAGRFDKTERTLEGTEQELTALSNSYRELQRQLAELVARLDTLQIEVINARELQEQTPDSLLK